MAVEATSLPRLTSPERLDRRPRYFTPNPVHLQGFATHRDPIIGTFKPQFTRTKRLQRSMSNMHERSMFEDTGFASTYYIIHPDWTSELHGRHMLSSKSKPHYSYENRPAVHPLSSYVEPLLEKRKKRDDYIKSMEQAKLVNDRQNTARESAMRRSLKPQTPRDAQGRYKSFTAY